MADVIATAQLKSKFISGLFFKFDRLYSRKNTPAAPIPVPIHIEVTSIYHINIGQTRRVLSTVSDSIVPFPVDDAIH